ncbi:MAG: ribosomal rRNA E-loop binding protein Ctc/L25/TL5 [Thermoleophilia bacterium]|nr:ribosomal rRNA E-loop binding protein Ctc/L25/TL5 [Thermoleophilia bacterium]
MSSTTFEEFGMARESLTIEKRDATNKSPEARRLRRTGRVPGVMYHADGNVPFSANELELAAVLRRGANLVDLKLDGAEHLTVLKSYDVHPVRGNLQHIDLQAVRMDQTIRTTVALNLVGESPGQKEGAILTQGIQQLLIETVASNIPDSIDLDISATHAGDTIILREVPAPEGVTILDDEGTMVVALTVPRGGKARKNAEGEQMTEDEIDQADAAEATAAAAASGGTQA